MKFILGKKIEMSQKFDEDGIVTPVTLVEAGPCKVTQVKTNEKDGYTAVQVGFGLKKKNNKAKSGHLKDLDNFRHLVEFRADLTEDLERGKEVKIDSFEKGDKLAVTGTSKGKGFAGVVKRYGFKGHPATHGHKDQLRMPGSIGSGGIQRVWKGQRMGGRMGGERVTVKNLEVVDIDSKNNIMAIKGAVPGARGSLILIVSK